MFATNRMKTNLKLTEGVPLQPVSLHVTSCCAKSCRRHRCGRSSSSSCRAAQTLGCRVNNCAQSRRQEGRELHSKILNSETGFSYQLNRSKTCTQTHSDTHTHAHAIINNCKVYNLNKIMPWRVQYLQFKMYFYKPNFNCKKRYQNQKNWLKIYFS